MGVGAIIENGQIVTTATQNSLSQEKTSAGESVNKDDFLQLLVAQMQYQDPLEPTENTQWVTQYAQFTQVEELQNMSQSMVLSRASSLVGQTVVMNVTDGSGGTTEVQGNVDFVTYEAGKAYLSIDGELYKMEDLANVVDPAYIKSMENVTAFAEALGKLPAVSALTLQDMKSVAGVVEKYDSLTDKEKALLGDQKTEYEKKLTEYMQRMSGLAADAKAQEEADAEAVAESGAVEEA